MKHLKITNYRTFLLLFLCSTFCITSYAQEEEKEKQQQELEEFFEYTLKLKANSNYNSKSRNGNVIIRPEGTNPFLSQGLDKGNVRSWRAYLKAKGKSMSTRKSSGKTSKIYKEKELPGKKSNDTRGNAERISGFSSVANQKNSIIIEGSLGDLSQDDPVLIETEEDNSFIDQATLISFSDSIQSVKVESALEDIEKAGQLSGDLDIYKADLKQGEIALINVTPETKPDFFPFLLVYNSQGLIVNFFSGAGPGLPYNVAFEAPLDDVFNFIVVDLATILTLAPTDIDIINDNAVFPLGVNGSYEVVFTKVDSLSTDAFQIPLKKGDVFGIAATNNALLTTGLAKPSNSLGIVTSFYGIFPVEGTPLPLDGDVGFHYIAPEDGIYTLFLTGLGEYSAEVDIARPGLETERRQYIYLDFTGVTDFTQREFFKVSEEDFPSGIDPELDRERTLSPLSSFLTSWGIDSTRINNIRLAQKVTRKVRENLEKELRASGINPNFDVRIISDFGIDRLGERLPRVLQSAGIPYSRVVVGGTIEESGIQTIGIANAIDVGNYSAIDDALTLLDVVSAPADIDGEGVGFPTINNIPLADNVAKIDLVAEVVGNITSHEAGHYLGNFHTTGANDTFSIMDEGGFGIFPQAGLFTGETFGEDDVNINFAKDVYSFNESFAGLDETDVNTAFALSTGRSIRKSNDNDEFFEEQIAALEAQAIKELSELLPSTFFSYPAPIKLGETSTLVVAPELSGKVDIELYDVQGRKITEVFKGNLNVGELLELKVDLGKLNVKSGFYFYKMISAGGEQTHSLIVE